MTLAPVQAPIAPVTRRPSYVGALGLGLALVAAVLPGCSDAPEPGARGTELNGTWETVCFPNNGMNFARTTLQYTDLAFVGTFAEYDDAACTRATHVSRWTGRAAVSGTTAAGETKLDLSFLSFTSTALTATNAAFNNTNAYCGLTDWAANVERNVLGAACYGFAIPVGGVSLDIYRVDAGTLRFGQSPAIGRDLPESSRPTMLSAFQSFTRRP